MTNLGYDAVKHHGPALLNYAVWGQLSYPPYKDDAADPLKEAQKLWRSLPPEQATALAAYGGRAWDYVSGAVARAAQVPDAEAAARTAIRKKLPHLDDWTFEVLWGVAYRRAMQ